MQIRVAAWGGRLSVDLPDDCGDAAYLHALQVALAQTAQRFPAPQLVFYLAGADPHEGDRLGRLRLSSAALAERDAMVFAWLPARHLPTVMLMAGGYPTDLAAWAQWKNARPLPERDPR